MLLAAYIVAGFVVAGVYAVGLLRGRRDRYQRLGFLIPFTVAAATVPFQIVVGDFAARAVFKNEPAKFASIEILPTTGTRVPETLGGVLINGKVRYGLPIPSGASLLAGLRREHPNRRPGCHSRAAAVSGSAGQHRPSVLRHHGGYGVRAPGPRRLVRSRLVPAP